MIKLFNISIDIMKVILPIIYIILGIITFSIIKKLILNSGKNNKRFKVLQNQRVKTLKTLVINIVKYIIFLIVVLAILSNFGVNVKSILAGLGIGTALIGLAFQDMAKDIIAGFSIITEGEYEIGDTIEIEGFMGEVVFIGLRTTRIRNFKGATKIIANRYMDNIINYSINNSLAIVDVGVSYDVDSEKVEKAIEGLFKRLSGKIEFATKEPELWGVNELADSSVVYRIAVETEPMKQFGVERFLKKEIKKEFDKENIKIPYKQIEVHNGK